MSSNSTPARHDWKFVAAETAAARTVVPLAIAVCRECGLVRSAVVSSQREAKLELRGDCPGR